MTRILFLPALVLTLPLQAQFDNMVTTDDGSTLLFQSQWRLAGSTDENVPKVFRWDSNGFAPVFSPPDPGFITPPSASSPVISGDGSIIGYLEYSGCSGAACTTTGHIQILRGVTLPPAFPLTALLQVSRNGRYIAAGSMVLDRNSGAVQVIGSGLPLGGRFGISDQGGMLLLILHQVFHFSTVDLVLSDQPGTVIINAPVIYTAVVSAAENRVIYESPSTMGQLNRQLWSYDVASQQATLLEDFNFGTFIGVSQYQPAISNDGMRLTYRRMNAATHQWEAVVHDYATGAVIVLGSMLASQNNFTITGDGKSVWLHRSDGRLVEMNIDSLAATETTGRHAWFARREGAAVYGSYNHLFGGGFSTGTGPLPAPDLSVDLFGLNCPLLTAAPQELDIQLPWEAYPGDYTMTLRNSSSPFESVQAIDVVNLAPTFERSGLPDDAIRDIKVVHDDFRGAATFADPAVPGETVHFYMTGLGDVQPRPPNGQPATFIAYASQRPLCWLISLLVAPQTPAPVLFAGMAPGMVGIYQVDVTIPASYPASVATIGCVDEGQGLIGDYGTFYVGKSQ